MSEVDDNVKQEKPRGKCTGCDFEYQLGTARSGEFKGQLVIRKHNSRTGPGLCSGAQRPPTVEHAEGCEGTATELPHDTQPDVPAADPWQAPAPYSMADAEAAGVGHGQLGPWVTATFDSDCDADEVCGRSILEGEQTRADGMGGWLCEDCGKSAEDCGKSAEDTMRPVTIAEVHAENPPRPTEPTPEQRAEMDRRMANPVASALASLPPISTEPDPWSAPGPMSDIPEKTVTVSGQPDPDRDRWGRYMILGQAHTRATTFAKLGANTKAIEAWNERNVIVGLTLRDDLLMMAQGKEVKRDKKELNGIAEQAKAAAGNKVAANIGTGYHSFTERIDAGLMTVDQVPERYRMRVQQYIDVTRQAGIQFRPEWIERTVAVRADQVSAPLPVAGMLDRIGQLPDGSLVIVDLKTGADLSYGEMEIEVQLALYAHGVNTHGLFDWNTKTWQLTVEDPRGRWPLEVRTDIAIVIHLPADGTGCELLVADIDRGWRDAQKLGQLQGSLKVKNRFRSLTQADLAVHAPAPVQSPAVQQAEAWQGVPQVADPWAPAHMVHAHGLFTTAPDKPTVAGLYQYAMDSGKFTEAELSLLLSVGTKRLRDLNLV